MSDFKKNVSQDDGDVEMVDLPASAGQRRVISALSHIQRFLSFRRRAVHILFIVFIVLLPLLIVLTTMPNIRQRAISFFVRPTPTPDIQYVGQSIITDSNGNLVSGDPLHTPVSGWAVASTPGPAPQNCSTAVIISTSPPVADLPVSIPAITGNGQKSVHMALHTASGWLTPLTLLLHVGSTETIRVSGGNSTGGLPLLFSQSPYDNPAEVLEITPPAHPASAHQGSAIWHISMYIPVSGCYLLSLTWENGGETIGFSAGL